MSFPINSLKTLNCKSTDIKVMKKIDLCVNCKEIPLPPYRSQIEPNNIYCRKCFDIKNFDPSSLIQPSNKDLKSLDKLIISCKFFENGCQHEFKMNDLDNLLFHEKHCLSNKVQLNLKEKNIDISFHIKRNYCSKCSLYFESKHDCITNIIKKLNVLSSDVIKLKEQNQLYECIIKDLKNQIEAKANDYNKTILSYQSKIDSFNLDIINKQIESNSEVIIKSFNDKIDENKLDYKKRINYINTTLEKKIRKSETNQSSLDQKEKMIKSDIRNTFSLADKLKNEIKQEQFCKMIGFNSNRVIVSKQSKWWCAKSEFVLNRAFEVKISIIKIDENRAKSEWTYAVGMIKNCSKKVTDYYKDSILLVSDGYKNKKFSGEYDKKLLNNNWKPGDLILIKRDNLNNVYIGLANEMSYQLEYESIEGSFQIIFGFSKNAREGDIFELTDLREI